MGNNTIISHYFHIILSLTIYLKVYDVKRICVITLNLKIILIKFTDIRYKKHQVQYKMKFTF